MLTGIHRQSRPSPCFGTQGFPSAVGHTAPHGEAGQGQTAEDGQGVKMGKGVTPSWIISREAEAVLKSGPGYQA